MYLQFALLPRNCFIVPLSFLRVRIQMPRERAQTSDPILSVTQAQRAPEMRETQDASHALERILDFLSVISSPIGNFCSSKLLRQKLREGLLPATVTSTGLVRQRTPDPGLSPDVKDPLTVMNLKDTVSGHGRLSGNISGQRGCDPMNLMLPRVQH